MSSIILFLSQRFRVALTIGCSREISGHRGWERNVLLAGSKSFYSQESRLLCLWSCLVTGLKGHNGEGERGRRVSVMKALPRRWSSGLWKLSPLRAMRTLTDVMEISCFRTLETTQRPSTLSGEFIWEIQLSLGGNNKQKGIVSHPISIPFLSSVVIAEPQFTENQHHSSHQTGQSGFGALPKSPYPIFCVCEIPRENPLTELVLI